MTERMDADAVKPCPWCGSTLPPVQRETDGSKWGALSCAECSAIAPEVRTGYGSEESWYADALREWNNRPAESAAVTALRAERDALRADLDDCFAQQGDIVGRLTAELDALRARTEPVLEDYEALTKLAEDGELCCIEYAEAERMRARIDAARHAPGVSDGE